MICRLAAQHVAPFSAIVGMASVPGSILACADLSPEGRTDSATQVARPLRTEIPLAVSSPTRRVAAVNWAAAESHPRAEVPDRLREAYAPVPLPVLIPNDQQLIEVVRPTRGSHWYAASMRLRERVVFVSGSRLEVYVPRVSRDAPELPDFQTRTTRSHGVVSASFRAYGVAYVIEVECAEPFGDPRCTNDDYVASLVDQLVFVGGKP